MKLLVIGGSYFLGKAFVKKAVKKHEVSLVNRGNRSSGDLPVTLYIGDRHDADAVSRIKESHFDVVVDFCAYAKGDVSFLTGHLSADFDQYIFISTCDVYRRGTMHVMDEESELETRNFGGQAGDYITGKVLLEQELRDCCKERNAAWTSIRPAFIYGEGNYAPREEIYFKWIEQAGQIIHPSDATGNFQMVYAEDAAEAILAACGNPIAYCRAYNLCGKEYMTYDSWADLLEKVTETPFERVMLPVREIMEREIPLPFPLLKEESQWYDGSRALELGIAYTPIDEGMKKTYQNRKKAAQYGGRQ